MIAVLALPIWIILFTFVLVICLLMPVWDRASEK